LNQHLTAVICFEHIPLLLLRSRPAKKGWEQIIVWNEQSFGTCKRNIPNQKLLEISRMIVSFGSALWLWRILFAICPRRLVPAGRWRCLRNRDQNCGTGTVNVMAL